MEKRLLILMALLAMILPSGASRAQEPNSGPLLTAFGGGYDQAVQIFIRTALERQPASEIKILVLPVAYASSAEAITTEERSLNLADAEKRRVQFLETCQRLTAAQGRACKVNLAPIFTRNDAEKIPLPLYFPEDLSGVFLLGGDQDIAMQVMAGTNLEDALQAAYTRGVLIGGTSAGTAVLSRSMLAGYRQGFSEADAFEFGAVDLWASAEQGGLTFGVQQAILDQHFFQRGRFGRLINTITAVEGPHLGIGVDFETGAFIAGNRVTAVGNTGLAVLDAQTFHAADSARYTGESQVLGVRNILVHLVPPGDFEYNLESREHSLQPTWQGAERSWPALKLPVGAGNLYLGGGLKDHLDGDPALNAFVNDSGGAQAHILIVAVGFSSRGSAQREAERYSAALQVATNTRVLMSADPPLTSIPAGTTGILLLGKDAAIIEPGSIQAVATAWQTGTPMLTDQAGTSAIGAYFASLGITPSDEEDAAPFTQQSFIHGKTPIKSGLGMLQISLEPELLTNNRWGRLFSLAYEHPTIPVIGLTAGTTLAVLPDAAQVLGDSAIVVLDFSHASLGLGANRAYAVANGLIDVFAPGEIVRAVAANRSFVPARAATPVISTPASPLQLTQAAMTPAAAAPALTLPPTSTPANTPVPQPTDEFSSLDDQEISTPTDPSLLTAMIVLGAIAMLVIMFGIWTNRQRINPR